MGRLYDIIEGREVIKSFKTLEEAKSCLLDILEGLESPKVTFDTDERLFDTPLMSATAIRSGKPCVFTITEPFIEDLLWKPLKGGNRMCCPTYPFLDLYVEKNKFGWTYPGDVWGGLTLPEAQMGCIIFVRRYLLSLGRYPEQSLPLDGGLGVFYRDFQWKYGLTETKRAGIPSYLTERKIWAILKRHIKRFLHDTRAFGI